MKKMDCKEDRNKENINDIMTDLKSNLISPVSDCNSNNLQVPKENLLLCSTDSINGCPDFLQDNSDYQWFLDYGYKENNYTHHQSILALSQFQDLVHYEDLARDFDANLAEVDMDDFNREDIHSVLSSLPNLQGVEEREMFASVSGSMMVKFGFDESMSPHTSSQEEPINSTSICKSQPLFSPVHESYMPNANLSVDSLDLSENDINLMVTCQANKHNYTIAFEGSIVMGSDESESRVTGTSRGSSTEENESNRSGDEFSKKPKCIQCFAQDGNKTMACSDFTTWSKIKKNSRENLQLRRHPSGNNNSTDTANCGQINNSSTMKSLSLPNLCRENQNSLDCQQRCIKLYDIQNNCNSKSVDYSTLSNSGKPFHNFSLLKLFMKQKSGSNELMSNYAKENAFNRLKSNIMESMENNKVATENFRRNEINKLRKENSFENVVENSLPPGKSDKFHLKNSKSEEKITEKFAPKIENKKYSINGKQMKDNYEFGNDNKYYSDESTTQENGSNTESAENLLCNCSKAVSNDFKKTLTEKSVQTSRLASSENNSQKSELKVPIYILYPNYSLPNLEFLKKEHYVQNVDLSKIFIRPQKFQTPGEQVSNAKNNKRPFSVNDIEALKKTGFKHVRDWESLTFLLPKEYKQFLQEIPEIVSQLKEVKNVKEELVPLFCLSPPPNRKLKKRPISCDLNFFNNNDHRSSNFSSTATQPSSGYRGSSTMLNSNNSIGASSPRNPSCAYKYDCNSESGSSRRSGSFMHSKYSRNFGEVPPPRPPLPKGILRNNSLDNQQYNCKIQKENANKRYSMIELSDRNSDVEDKFLRRRSAQNLNHFQPFHPSKSKQVSKQTSLEKISNKGNVTGTDSEEIGLAKEQPKMQNDLRRLEEFLEISAVFGENTDSFTENDMMKLRSQVSRFLTMHKNLEKVSETLQTVDETAGSNGPENASSNMYQGNQSLEVTGVHTPHNTPEHKKQHKGGCEKDHTRDLGNLLGTEHSLTGNDCRSTSTNDPEEDYFSEEIAGGLKKTVSFAERISFAVKEMELIEETSSLMNQKLQGKCKRPISLSICEESMESSLGDSTTKRDFLQSSSDLLRKRELVLDVKRAVEKIIKVFEDTREDPTNLCLHDLCPSLYAILSDGLKEEIETPFGPIRNSVWGVIEASSQGGPMTRTLNELVQRLNRDDVFTEGLIKFNAFIFGLINARTLSGWLSYLRTRDGLLRKYYDNSGLLLMSNTAGAPVRLLIDQLINALEPLSSMRFNLDLMYQTKLLHCSLQNLNDMLEGADNNDFLTPTKQFMLLKLVQSIQNSISQGGEGKRNKHLLEDIDKKTSDPPVANLLERNKFVRNRREINKTRPRSGCDILGKGKKITDVTTVMKKRWSGVHTNSKLAEAYEKLGNDSDSDYTDILDNQKLRNQGQKKCSLSKTVSTKRNETCLKSEDSHLESNTKEQKKNILLNLNKKSCGKAEDCKTELDAREEGEEDSTTQLQIGGLKFKRLQQKWEKLSGQSDFDSEVKTIHSESKSTPRGNGASDKPPTPEKFNCDTNVTGLPSPTSRISKIPRLVSSPSPCTPSIKGGLKTPSPTFSPASTNQKTGKGSVSSKGHNVESRVSPSSTNRLSRFDEKSNNSGAPSERGHVVRPSSLPYRGCSTMPVTKTESAASRRASSASLNRRTTPGKSQVQSIVRTLTHRLSSDSGHLSFNEGEKLKVVLEVDKTWLLCCRGTQKGLVPKSAVISDVEGSKF